MKKQRKSSSSDSDFYETQAANKHIESKSDEQIASTSITALTPQDDENVAGPSNVECMESDDQPPHDDEMIGRKATVEQRPKPNLPTSPTSLSNSSSVSTGSSPEALSLPNTSTEHEQSIEKDIERKLLQKIEYHLMEIFQHLEEIETAESESSSSQYTNTTQSKLNCTSDTSTISDNITATSHKVTSATSSLADDEIANEPGPSK